MIKVLIVDDSALVRKLFGRVLTSETGFEIAFARNGVEALEQLESFRPQVITLDVNMPQMDGIECLDQIMIHRPTPVVMVSTLTAAGAELTLDALRLGAIDFVAKPAGAVSLRIDEFAPILIEKICAAVSAKLPASRRLKERVQRRAAIQRQSVANIQIDSTETKVEAAVGYGIVLVGTSTGGPPALEALLAPLSAAFPWPIVVAQHMPAGFTSSLATRLDNLCSIKVVEASRSLPLQAGCVYIGRGDADVVIARHAAGLVVKATPAKSNYPWHPSTERLVRSAMEHMPATQLIGILMTGMGNDGAAAMTELHTNGGKTIAESEETAVVWGMPGELVRLNGADWVLPLPKIAAQLQMLVPSHATDT